jgi:hypothetical protein
MVDTTSAVYDADVERLPWRIVEMWAAFGKGTGRCVDCRFFTANHRCGQSRRSRLLTVTWRGEWTACGLFQSIRLLPE